MHDHFSEVEGVRLHWAEVGETSRALPIVLIHGLTNSCSSWSQVAPLLGTDRRVLMPDLPGHGQSERPNVDYALHWYARIIARWLEVIGIEQADVVGHSFGGGVAQMLLLECPERIRRLVLVSAGGLGKGVGWWLRLASLPGVVEHLGQPFMALGTRLALSSARDGVTPDEIRELSRLNAQSGSARALARSVRDVIDWRGQRRHFRDRAHEIAALPAMLVIWGDRDTLIPIEQGRAFAESLDGVIFKAFKGVGHYPHNERPEAFVRAVRDFLDDPSVPATRLRRATSAKELDLQGLGSRELELLELSFQPGSKEKRRRNVILSALISGVGLLLLSYYGAGPLALTATALVIVVVSALERASCTREILMYESLVRALARRLEEVRAVPEAPEGSGSTRASG